jgi:RNA polymerase sigma factor (sigma-70 family)
LLQALKIQALTDEELIEAYKQENDNIYLGKLFDRYIRFVFLVCMKYLKNEELSKDMAMQVFEKLTDDIKKHEVKNFKSWLHVVTKNSCLMYIRSNKPFDNIFISTQIDAQNFMENIPEVHHDSVQEKELKLVQLEKAIETLENEQQKCIELFFLKEMSYKEVSDITGYSMNEVKSHIQNGKRNLKNYLLANGEVIVFVFFVLNYLK